MSLIAELAPGAIIGGAYRIQQHLRDGGQGSIYVAEQLGTGALRALKLMLPSLVHDERLRKLFMQEARVGAQIRSDHVVQVVGAGIDEPTGMPWIAMELLEGEDLADLLARREHVDAKEVLEIYGQLCHALLAAHMVGVVHRDLKPENIFLAESRTKGLPFTVKVLDFGLAKLIYEAQPSTSSTAAKGTWTFLAPEQTEEHGQILPATDVWALGLLAYRLLTGYPYWSSAASGPPQIQVLLREILHDRLPPPSERAERFGFGDRIPHGFDAWFLRCLSRDPEQRYTDAGEAGEALKLALSGSPTIKLATIDPSQIPGDEAREASPASLAGTTSQRSQRSLQSVPAVDHRAGQRRLALALTGLAGLALLCLLSATAWRARYSLEARERTCEQAAAGSGHAPERVLEDCAHACDAGSTRHCRLYADLVFRDAVPAPAPRDRAISGYRQACDLDDIDACFRYASLVEAGAAGQPDPATAARVYDRACGHGDLASCYRLGVLLDEGRGTPRDRRRALALLNRACDGGQGDACARIAAMLDASRRDESDFEMAVGLHAAACEHGKLDSCTRYGRLLFLGRGVPRDPVKAAALFGRACDGGDDAGCYELGRHLIDGGDGDGIPRDPARALTLFQRLCERHSADGCHSLGVLYREGIAVLRDPKRAAQLFAEACDGGRIRSCSALGELVDAGQGFARKDHPRALDLYKQGCDGGDPGGCRDLAEAAERDPDTRRNKGLARGYYERAFTLYKTGCDAGFAPQCAEEGKLLLDGKGVAHDNTRAATLFDQACHWDDPTGCGQLGLLFVAGRGVSRDPDKGDTLLRRSCDAGLAWACVPRKSVGRRGSRPTGKNPRAAGATGGSKVAVKR